jgi:putative endonuclease
MKPYWCYIMSNKSRRLCVGFTDDLFRRVIEHKEKLFPGSFTARYTFDMLVFYEEYAEVGSAEMREKEIKGWSREKKLKLILAENPDWADQSLEWKDKGGMFSPARVHDLRASCPSRDTCSPDRRSWLTARRQRSRSLTPLPSKLRGRGIRDMCRGEGIPIPVTRVSET